MVQFPTRVSLILYGLLQKYRGLLYSAQNIAKKDPGRARQSSVATAVTNFTKPGAHNKGDLCTSLCDKSPPAPGHCA